MSLTVVTASYAPDFASFARLHESVVRNTEDDVRHVVAVPNAHVDLFRSIDSPRLDVRSYGAILPRRFLQTAWIQTIPGIPRGFRVAAVNATRPWPPIRGWIMQQAIKLAVVSELTSEVALLIDSDVVVVRPLRESTFRTAAGAVRLYRVPRGIDDDMTRHVAQRERAMHLLGVQGIEVDSPDYISAFVSWRPALVRSFLDHIESSTGTDWWNAVTGSLDFSEYITYGTFVMSTAEPGERELIAESSLCHSHWGKEPLTMTSAQGFIDSIRDDDVAVHVQSNSSTEDVVVDHIVACITRA